jgi:hypothetical protein
VDGFGCRDLLRIGRRAGVVLIQDGVLVDYLRNRNNKVDLLSVASVKNIFHECHEELERRKGVVKEMDILHIRGRSIPYEFIIGKELSGLELLTDVLKQVQEDYLHLDYGEVASKTKRDTLRKDIEALLKEIDKESRRKLAKGNPKDKGNACKAKTGGDSSCVGTCDKKHEVPSVRKGTGRKKSTVGSDKKRTQKNSRNEKEME